ncbi:MAG: hypothetical protein KGN01_06425 [Patescibacteria group bacterium]|nr:hypothetical protein [Patescibacteria group bacterium]
MKRAILLVAIVALILVVSSLIAIPLLSQAHTQSTITSIGTANLDVYLNFTDGTAQHLSSSAPLALSVYVNGKALSAIMILVSDELNSSITNQSISTSATSNGQNILLQKTASSPATYVMTSLSAGSLSISASISAISHNAVYLATLPALNITLTQGSTTMSQSTSTQTKTTQTTETQTQTYPYGLPQTLTSAYPITWTLLTCSSAESLYGVGSCQHLYATYSPGVQVTTVSWSTATGEVISINGQTCQQIGANGLTNPCFSTFSVGSGTFANCVSGCTVYSQDGYYP